MITLALNVIAAIVSGAAFLNAVSRQETIWATVLCFCCVVNVGCVMVSIGKLINGY